jgi:hypothetical protein
MNPTMTLGPLQTMLRQRVRIPVKIDIPVRVVSDEEDEEVI